MAPEPDEIDEKDDKKVRPQRHRCGNTMREKTDQYVRQYQKNDENSGQQEQLVTHAGQSARDSSRLNPDLYCFQGF